MNYIDIQNITERQILLKCVAVHMNYAATLLHYSRLPCSPWQLRCTHMPSVTVYTYVVMLSLCRTRWVYTAEDHQFPLHGRLQILGSRIYS